VAGSERSDAPGPRARAHRTARGPDRGVAALRPGHPNGLPHPARVLRAYNNPRIGSPSDSGNGRPSGEV
jgi:hypothetical protein